MVRKRRPDPTDELTRALATSLRQAHHRPASSRRPAWQTKSMAIARRAATPPPRKWTTETNQAVSKALVPAPPPALMVQPSPTDMERRWRLNELKRQAMMPHLWTFGTGVAGTVGWGAVALMDLTVSGGAATLTGLVIGGGAAAVSTAVGVGRRREIRPHGARFALAAAASSTWVTAASLGGVSWWQLALLAVGNVAIGAGYWRALRLERKQLLAPPAPAPAPAAAAPGEDKVYEPEPDDGTEAVILNWTRYVAGARGALPGSTLTNVTRTPLGIQATVNLEPGTHTLVTALEAVPRVRTGLMLASDGGDEEPSEEVIFDQPSRIDGTRLQANQLRLQIVEKSPVRQSPWYERPQLAKGEPGTALIGLYADGQGYAPWKVFDRDGVWGGVIIAGIGAGKSSLMDVLAIAARSTGVMNVGFVDPQGGASSPILRDHASIVALGPDQILPVLEALEGIARGRETYLNAHGLSALVPGMTVRCPAGCTCGGRVPPGLIVFIDECDQVFGVKGPEGRMLGERFGVLAKRVRKLGVGFVCASQHSGMQIFGNSELLRSNVATKNYVAFHSASHQTGTLIPGLEINPKTLPKRKGYGVIAGENTRVAPFRSFFAPRKSKDGDLPAPVWAEDLAAAHPEPPLHPIDAAALRGKLADPSKVAQQAQQAALADLAALMRGSQPADGSPTGEGVTSFSRIAPVPAPVVVQLPQRLDPSALNETDRAVLAIMQDGHTQTGDIVAAYGVDNATNRRRAHEAFDRLIAAGLAKRQKKGVYVLTERGRRNAA